ncbi:DUF1178 family protein [Limobrevibacterium gyesilva]|uniref:DUF1178 family protein n=1 Tax=Limobrevibacterium gyesilva TaxID=2991712 RepID=A0AA41YGY0_9PROT|nr:DUF1178 family protein [Limobrevibacterium gyesilva]MCW3472949.1 DUF1178 family protein [Limobrevibacterium gyesilva]
MIHYQLQCSAEHGFDGWFKDSASFEKQAKRGLLECPICGTTEVERALMTPSVPRKGRAAKPKTADASAPTAPVAVAAEKLPDHVRAMLQKLRTEIEQNCDYVGGEFAEEARRIHRGESGKRGIYGEATSDEAEALAEEGIEIAKIPWVPRADG